MLWCIISVIIFLTCSCKMSEELDLVSYVLSEEKQKKKEEKNGVDEIIF